MSVAVNSKEGSPEVWLDYSRRPRRRFLASLQRGRSPAWSPSDPWETMQQTVGQRWAGLLGVSPDDLVICTSPSEAFSLVAGALLLPEDVSVLAEPVDEALVAAIAGVGAAWVDVSRTATGALESAALTLVDGRHPGAVFFGMRPSYFGGDDLPEMAAVEQRGALIVDARGLGSLWGEAPQGAQKKALATLIALRDPDAPAIPLLYAWVCAPGTGPGLRALQGPALGVSRLLPIALAALDRLGVDGQACQERFDRRLSAARERFESLLASRVGVVVHPLRGIWAVAECLGGDAVELAKWAGTRGLFSTAWGPHPTRNLVVCELARVRDFMG